MFSGYVHSTEPEAQGTASRKVSLDGDVDSKMKAREKASDRMVSAPHTRLPLWQLGLGRCECHRAARTAKAATTRSGGALRNSRHPDRAASVPFDP